MLKRNQDAATARGHPYRLVVHAPVEQVAVAGLVQQVTRPEKRVAVDLQHAVFDPDTREKLPLAESRRSPRNPDFVEESGDAVGDVFSRRSHGGWRGRNGG